MAMLQALVLSLISVAFADNHALTVTPLGTATGSCMQGTYPAGFSTVSDLDDRKVQCFVTASDCTGTHYAAGYQSKYYDKCCHCYTGCDMAAQNVSACKVDGIYADTYGDYVAVSAVSKHAAVVLDVTMFEKHIGNKNYTGAKAVYTGGMHSPKSPWRTTQGFAKKNMDGTGSNKDVKIWQHQKAAFKSTSNTFQDDFMLSILDGTGMFASADDGQKDQAADKTMQCIMVNYVMYEFIAAIAKAKAGTTMTDAKGGAHNWDEGRAFYYGPYWANAKDAPWEIAKKRDADYGTKNGPAIDTAMSTGLGFVRGATPDIDKATAEYNKIVKHMMIAFVQAGLKYAYKAATASGTAGKYELMEGYAYFRCGAGMLYGSSAKGKTATEKTLKLYEDAIKAGKTTIDFCEVKEALMDAGLTAAEIGTSGKVAGADAYKNYKCSSTPAATTTKSGAAGVTFAAGLALAVARAL